MTSVNLCFDTETLGLYERAVVTSIGCVAFTFEGNTPYSEMIEYGFFAKFQVEEQIKKYKRVTTPSTMQFWAEQTKEAREKSIMPSPNDVSLEDGLQKLKSWIKESGYDFKNSFVWSRGNAFDFPKIESMYLDADISCPFNTWKIRDIRTFIDCLAGTDRGMYDLKNGEPEGFVKHHSLHDAAHDAAKMIEIYQNLKSEQ